MSTEIARRTPGRRLRLLCLDGGGVRGLASLFLLKQILSHVGNPKPYLFFDMIAGTSTGGLIAIMLGRLKMSVVECIEHYVQIMDEIFHKKQILPFNLHNGKISSRYATNILEKHIKRIITESGSLVDEEMREVDPRCKVFVVAVSAGGGNAVRFTNYERPHQTTEMFNEARIWEAARATSSAPTFFDPIDISCNGIKQRFIDGGLGYNNPVNELWMEAQSEFGNPLEPQIRLILSIGTGRPAMKQVGNSLKGFGETLIRMASETQATAKTFHRMHQDLADIDGYFRFNPPDLDEVGLDEATKKDIILQRVAFFGDDPDVEKAMKRFKVVATGSDLHIGVPMKPVNTEVYKEAQVIPFSNLDRTPRYIRPGVSTYWNFLTLDAYIIYEKIHGLCISPNSTSGMVHISSFLQQIEVCSSPTRLEAIEVWSRLLSPEQKSRKPILDSQHPKAFVMATLYMLHVEGCFKSQKPRLENGEIGIDKHRREALKRFTKWVPCMCHDACNNEWNFANDMGLSRGSAQSCKVERFLTQGTLPNLFRSQELSWLKTMHESWRNSKKLVC